MHEWYSEIQLMVSVKSLVHARVAIVAVLAGENGCNSRICDTDSYLQ